jgi:hypothetical protein
MANISQTQVLTALAALVDAVPDTGLVLTEEKFVESESEFMALFRSKNSNVAHGWLINYAGCPDQLRDGTCDITRSLKYTLETLYPYDAARDADGKNSKDRFIEQFEAVNTAFNTKANWYLGLGNKVEHQLLKTVEDFVVRKWGEGADARLAHYGVSELFVSVTNKY